MRTTHDLRGVPAGEVHTHHWVQQEPQDDGHLRFCCQWDPATGRKGCLECVDLSAERARHDRQQAMAARTDKAWGIDGTRR